MYSRTQTIQSTELGRTKDLLYSIAINDLDRIKKGGLITKTNVNAIIEQSSRSNALHYSLIHQDGAIARYLLELGADPYAKNLAGKDAFQVSLDNHKRHVFDYVIETKDSRISDLVDESSQLRKKLKLESDSRTYLQKSVDDYRLKVNNLESTNSVLKLENTELKEQVVGLKRKVIRLNESIDGFLNSNKK
jgi:hypothetical protein